MTSVTTRSAKKRSQLIDDLLERGSREAYAKGGVTLGGRLRRVKPVARRSDADTRGPPPGPRPVRAPGPPARGRGAARSRDPAGARTPTSRPRLAGAGAPPPCGLPLPRPACAPAR